MSHGQYQPRRASPGGFALVVALHAAALGAVLLVKGPAIIGPDYGPIEIFNVPNPPEPDPLPPEPQPRPPIVRPSSIETVIPVVAPPVDRDVVLGSLDPAPPFDGLGNGPVVAPPADPPAPPTPVRREAEIDSNFAAAFRPPYPPSELRAQRDGVVRLRVTIGADGRVRAVQRISATSDAFWAAAERQARTRWRFRPATVDGRPVESTKVLTLRFRIEDA